MTFNLAKLPEKERGADFDLIMQNVMNTPYADEFEKAAAVQKAMQAFITYQKKIKPTSFDAISPRQNITEEVAQPIVTVKPKKSPLSNAQILALYQSSKRKGPPVPKKPVLSRDVRSVIANIVLENRTRGQKGGWIACL